MNRTNQAADAAVDMLRVSMDAKAMVKIGPFSRGGKSRVPVAAADHDFAPDATVTPVGIFVPTLAELCIYGVTSNVTSDCLVDRLAPWWESVRKRFAHLTTLVINLDHGPEHHSRRTQCMQRLVDFVQHDCLTVRLAYSPPSYSKYNPIERCWGILEHHWHGTVLDAFDTVLKCARTMTWQGQHPIVALVTTAYETGVTLTKDAMQRVEAQIKRLPDVGKWFIDIVPPGSDIEQVKNEKKSFTFCWMLRQKTLEDAGKGQQWHRSMWNVWIIEGSWPV